MSRLDRAVTTLARCLVRTVPANRREWAEAVWAETAEIPARRRLSWLMGGWWTVIRQAGIVRRLAYGLGVAALAAGASDMVSLVWQGASVAPGFRSIDVPTITMGAGIYVSPSTNGDVRALAVTTVAVLAVLPWVGRKQQAFGPVADSLAARLVRVGGCAAIGLLVLVLARLAQTLGEDLVPGGALAAATVTALTVILLAGVRLRLRAREDLLAPEIPALLILGFALPIFLFAADVAAGGDTSGLMAVYAAGILAVTARGSRIAPATLGFGAGTGIAGGLVWYAAVRTGNPGLTLAVVVLAIAAPTAAGAAAAWRTPRRDAPDPLSDERLRQGLAAGGLAGGVAVLLLTVLVLGTMVVLHQQAPARSTEGYILLLLAAPAVGMMLGLGGGSVLASRQPSPAPPSPLAQEPAP